ncbi:MAG TPA: TA system VapC family ribonuclease toxin [Burkholderiaceae bacterium]|nr:TA system VapC family ribonuclease toxin [Burkholderiaceae bacterium]
MAASRDKAAPQIGVREPRARYVSAQPAARRVEPDAPRRALLDVNVLIALLDSDHVHHARAGAWLGEHIAAGWASCAITQNGCVRIMSRPGYPNALPAARVAQRLREATETDHHLFVPSDLSLLDTRRFDTDQLLGHRQVTGAWLLGLAVRHELRFVTFDAGVTTRIVRGVGAGHVVVL